MKRKTMSTSSPVGKKWWESRINLKVACWDTMEASTASPSRPRLVPKLYQSDSKLKYYYFILAHVSSTFGTSFCAVANLVFGTRLSNTPLPRKIQCNFDIQLAKAFSGIDIDHNVGSDACPIPTTRFHPFAHHMTKPPWLPNIGSIQCDPWYYFYCNQ